MQSFWLRKRPSKIGQRRPFNTQDKPFVNVIDPEKVT